MVSVSEIEQAIQHLAIDQLAEFRAWFEAFDAASWDESLRADPIDSPLSVLAQEALRDHRANLTTPL